MARKLRNIKLYVFDILNSINKIELYTADMSFESFSKDSKTIDAVIRNFEILGGASSHLPISFKKNNSEVEWRILIDFRNVIIHEYFGVNLEIIWDIIKNEIPILKSKIQILYNSMEDYIISIE